ncbi:MAG: glycyl-radical enzyme activating protein [Deltaproteobacteria bacterium]|nr:glycyl-radical enzyme activating protein [Deltaproteobacteria bacterium]
MNAGWRSSRFQLYQPDARRDEPVGLISDFQRFSVHDGPGIRTIVFLKGCPLHCVWCQNPETISHLPEIMLVPNNCIGCGKCLEACPNSCTSCSDGRVQAVSRRRCLLPECGNCQRVRYANAINICGRYLTVGEVLEELERDLEFYCHTGGGVTFSGGEPFAQPRFLDTLARRAKERKLHTAVETCGYVQWEILRRVMESIDIVLFDIKHMDGKRHRQGTGVSNDLILVNLKRLDALGIPIRVRLPLVPGFNDNEENIQATAAFAAGLENVQALDILPYHRMGEPKWGQLEKPYELHGVAPHDREEVLACADIAREYGVEVTVGG